MGTAGCWRRTIGHRVLHGRAFVILIQSSRSQLRGGVHGETNPRDGTHLLGGDLAQAVFRDAGALAHHDALEVRQRRQQQQREAHVRDVVAAADVDVLQAYVHAQE